MMEDALITFTASLLGSVGGVSATGLIIYKTVVKKKLKSMESAGMDLDPSGIMEELDDLEEPDNE